jgi:hypothetical protein
MLAGLAGGVAEIAWIGLYAAFSGGDAAEMARGVALAASSGRTDSAVAGIAVHMLLAAALGIAIAFACLRVAGRFGRVAEYGLVLLVLAAVWKVNFFVLLPLISPAFVSLLPLSATLTSKLLFGLAAAAVLRFRTARS